MDEFYVLIGRICEAIIKNVVTAKSFKNSLEKAEFSKWYERYEEEQLGKEKVEQFVLDIWKHLADDIIEFTPNMGAVAPRAGDDFEPIIETSIDVPSPNRTPREYIRDLKKIVEKLEDKREQENDEA